MGGRARPLAEVACSSGKSALEQSGGPAPARSGPLDCVPVAFPCQSRGNGRPDKAPCLRVAPWATIDLEFLKVQLESAEDHFSTGDSVGASRPVKWHERVRNIITLVAHTKRKARTAVYTILHVGVIQTNGATAKVPSVANRVADCSLACGPPRMTPSTHPRQYEPFPTSLWASGSRYLISARCWVWVPQGQGPAYGRVTPHAWSTTKENLPKTLL